MQIQGAIDYELVKHLHHFMMRSTPVFASCTDAANKSQEPLGDHAPRISGVHRAETDFASDGNRIQFVAKFVCGGIIWEYAGGCYVHGCMDGEIWWIYGVEWKSVFFRTHILFRGKASWDHP